MGCWLCCSSSGCPPGSSCSGCKPPVTKSPTEATAPPTSTLAMRSRDFDLFLFFFDLLLLLLLLRREAFFSLTGTFRFPSAPALPPPFNSAPPCATSSSESRQIMPPAVDFATVAGSSAVPGVSTAFPLALDAFSFLLFFFSSFSLFFASLSSFSLFFASFSSFFCLSFSLSFSRARCLASSFSFSRSWYQSRSRTFLSARSCTRHSS
mmetsp:Transcript_6457/g.15701  ORF Transcript_6457/g.15701 Transcript_6457/m.15701 type:complete len:208 (+) Transcript_6457:40-663(+)